MVVIFFFVSVNLFLHNIGTYRQRDRFVVTYAYKRFSRATVRLTYFNVRLEFW